jgi:hypothetical protein
VSPLTSQEKLLCAVERLRELAELDCSPDNISALLFINGEILEHIINLD